jgi:rRNA maturation RNase YbeY
LIQYFNEDIAFKLDSFPNLCHWLSNVIKSENHQQGDINYIFCSKPYLLELNRNYLDHDYHTDILTFDQSAESNTISGDIYISVEQVAENAEQYQQSFSLELKRVMLHGILHLLGYNDQTPEEQFEMRKKEEAYLSL